MGFYFRVPRGSAVIAVRTWNRMTQAEPPVRRRGLRGQPFNEKPTARRRREYNEGVRRRKYGELMTNLHAIYARKRRGF